MRVVVHDSLFGNSMDQAEAEGRADGKAGRSANCRYAEDTPEYEEFWKAYNEEQAKHMPGKPETETQEEKEEVEEPVE